MKKEIQIKTIDMVRKIRDEQSLVLAGKSRSEIIAFFRSAGESYHQKSQKKQATKKSL